MGGKSWDKKLRPLRTSHIRDMIAEDFDHMIHFNGEHFCGPYPDVMPKQR